MSNKSSFFSARCISASFIPAIRQLARLHSLTMLGCTLEPETVAGIDKMLAGCAALTSINLNGCRTTRNGPDLASQLVRACPQLERLSLNDTQLPLSVSTLAELRELKLLSLASLWNLNAHDIKSFFARIRPMQLEHLNMTYSLSIELDASWFSNCGQLRALSLYGNGAHVREESLQALSLFCPKIERLDLGQCVSFEPTLRFLTNLGFLSWLNLSQCVQVSDLSCPALLACPALQYLGIFGVNLSDRSLMSLIEVPNLVKMEIAHPPHYLLEYLNRLQKRVGIGSIGMF